MFFYNVLFSSHVHSVQERYSLQNHDIWVVQERTTRQRIEETPTLCRIHRRGGAKEEKAPKCGVSVWCSKVKLFCFGFFFSFFMFSSFLKFFLLFQNLSVLQKKWNKVSLSGSESSSIRNTILKDWISLLLNYDALPKVLILHLYWIRYVCILLTRFFHINT